MRAGDRVLLALVGAAVAVPILARGGFTDGSRALFVALAGAALTAAFWLDDRAALRSVRAPMAILLALAGLSAASAAWSLADTDDVIRWAFVIAGYGALAVAASVLVLRTGAVTALVILVAVALAAGLTGIVGAGLRELPWAERIGGSWRPGGTVEYAPALALLQVSALPILLAAMRARPQIAVPAAGAAAVAGVIVALSESRLQLGLGLALALGTAAVMHRAGARARDLTLALAVPLLAGVAARFAAGGFVEPGDTDGDVQRLAVLLGLPAVAALAWAFLRRYGRVFAAESSAPAPRRAAWSRTRVAAVACAMLAVFAGLVALRGDAGEGRGIEPRGGVLHGRSDTWSAAAEAAGDEAPLGAGAESFLLASSDEQGADKVLYAHNLPLEQAVELGIPGLVLVLALYVVCALVLWRARRRPAALLAGAAVAAFLITNLLDWPWHLAGVGAFCALALGAVMATGPAAASEAAAASRSHARAASGTAS